MVRCPPSPPSPAQLDMERPRSSSPDGMDHEANLLLDLHRLHADEFVYLTQRLTDLERKCEESWIYRSFAIFKQYILFVLRTWVKALWALVFFPTTLMDRIALGLISFGVTIVMTVLLPWCVLCNIPITIELFDRVSRRLCNGLSIVNASYPTIFDELSFEHIQAAKAHLSQPIEYSNNRPHRRVFNLDASKLLLQCAALMYERSSRTTHRAAVEATTHCTVPRRRQTDWSLTEVRPGSHIAHLCGSNGEQAVIEALHGSSNDENTVTNIARDKLGLCYSTVSELNSLGSAFCGLFWDPRDSFIIVAFKGTTPTDFAEWSTDFTIQMRDAGLWLRGFGKVHDGFMDKVFPRRIPSGSRMPYATVIESIKCIASSLLNNAPDRKINIWITGHSLGCALASLFYSRLVSETREYGDNIIIRDAYLFAAPVVCDVASANAFNGRMNHFSDFPRTMWRVTNGRDFVATGLPDAGDNAEWLLSPWNLFSYSHLGCEIKLRDAPERCEVRGSHITPGTHVVIESAFHLDSIKANESPLRVSLLSMQKFPMIGRMLAHGTGFYWAALQGVGTGTCEWVFD